MADPFDQPLTRYAQNLGHGRFILNDDTIKTREVIPSVLQTLVR